MYMIEIEINQDGEIQVHRVSRYENDDTILIKNATENCD